MTEPTPDLDARLARLAARKAAARTTVAVSTPSASPPQSRRRRHPAAASRILSVGLSSSAFLSLVAAFAQTNPYSAPATAAISPAVTAPPARTRIVVRDVHHVQYVDQFGRPIAAPTATPPSTASQPRGGTHSTPNGRSAAPSSAGASGSRAAPPAAPIAPTTPPPAPSGTTPPPSGTTPTTGRNVSPPTTARPTPTTQPTPVTTPPPPPPPPCSGTKCPKP